MRLRRAPKEPTHLSVLMRFNDLTLYSRGGTAYIDHMEATPERVEINGHVLTPEEMQRGWVVIDGREVER